MDSSASLVLVRSQPLAILSLGILAFAASVAVFSRSAPASALLVYAGGFSAGCGGIETAYGGLRTPILGSKKILPMGPMVIIAGMLIAALVLGMSAIEYLAWSLALATLLLATRSLVGQPSVHQVPLRASVAHSSVGPRSNWRLLHDLSPSVAFVLALIMLIIATVIIGTQSSGLWLVAPSLGLVATSALFIPTFREGRPRQ
jgi:hypothetical protein